MRAFRNGEVVQRVDNAHFPYLHGVKGTVGTVVKAGGPNPLPHTLLLKDTYSFHWNDYLDQFRVLVPYSSPYRQRHRGDNWISHDDRTSTLGLYWP